MEQARFIITQKPTKQDFILFNRTISNQEFHFRRTLIVINIIQLLFWGFFVSSYGAGDTSQLCMLGTIAVFVIAYTNWSIFRNRDKKAAKLYDQNKVFGSLTKFQISLFDDHLESLTDCEQGTVSYDKLYKIIESPTHFYFMYSKMQGIIIAKESEDQRDFILKLKEKYKL